jgi:hypothetical protein
LRNNLERPATYSARLLAPAGWEVSPEFRELKLAPGAAGELSLEARAPQGADGVRRLMTAEVAIDGQSQGPISESVVTVS